MLTIYGIKNCDTMKKTFKWLDANNVKYEFVDYKKTPPTSELLESFLANAPLDVVINKRGTTWRKLPDDVKTSVNDTTAIRLMQDNPSIIKRPIILHQQSMTVGFNTEYLESLI